MTISRCLVLLLLLFPSSAVALSSIETTATITAVTLYQDRALTIRTATARLKPGSNLITITGLPVLMQDDSLQVAGTGTAGTTINSIEVRRRFLEQSAEKRVKEIEGEITALELTLNRLDSKKAGILAQKSFLDSIRVAWSERISRELTIHKPTLAELKEIMGFVGDGVTKADEQIWEIEAEKKLLKAKIDALKQQKNAVTGSELKESKIVEVMVEAREQGTLTLELSGVVSQASWEPAYDVRLADDGMTAGLTCRATVRQQTGEDWNNVSLTLSTARPATGGAPPELPPWRISFPRPRSTMALHSASAPPEMRMMKSSAKMMEAEDAVNGPPQEALATFQTAAIDSTTTSVSFKIPKTVNIAADGSRHRTVISVVSLPVTTQYVAVPKLTSSVWLTAELTNSSPFPLLPGEIRIFSGATFIGSATMKKTAAGEKFTLPFGSDDQVMVLREELKQHKEAGLFGSNRMSYRYKVKVTNLRKKAQLINVIDQIPIPENSEIKVKLDETGLKPDEQKGDGTIIWKLELAPYEKREFSFGIVVEYPEGREVVGL